MARLNLVSPWFEYYHKMKALFGEDPDINIVFDDELMELKFYVGSPLKAEVLEKFICPVVKWGDVVLNNIIIPGNREYYKYVTGEEMPVHEMLYYLFSGNPHFADILYIDTIFSNGITYVMFKKEVIQYYTDDLGDPHGITSILMEDLAKELLNSQEGVFYCTDVE